MIVFLSTQNSVDFHHQLFTEVFNSPSPAERSFGAAFEEEGSEEKEEVEEKEDDDPDKLELFKLHGDMPQKV
jgi:hypothetical protein